MDSAVGVDHKKNEGVTMFAPYVFIGVEVKRVMFSASKHTPIYTCKQFGAKGAFGTREVSFQFDKLDSLLLSNAKRFRYKGGI